MAWLSCVLLMEKLFCGVRQVDIKVHMENKHARMARKTLENLKAYRGGLALAYIKAYYKACN